jgi:hypothetical protein
MTSYGKRLNTAWKAVETIANGTVRPNRMILWVDEIFDSPQLYRLRKRGLEVVLCKDYGPHKKYFPYVQNCAPATLVTADDDTYYPPTWLEELLSAHRDDQITAYRARVRSEGPYASWPICATMEPSELHLATGVSGVAYPPVIQHALREKGDAFMGICPRADDFWLHYAGVATGLKTRQVREEAALWWEMPMASRTGLWDGKGTSNDAIHDLTRKCWLG